MERCSLSDVMAAQAYILFYMQLDSSAQSPQPHSSSASTFASTPSQTLAINRLFPQPGSRRDNSASSSSRGQPRKITEKADDQITFNFKNSSVQKFDRLQGGRKRKAENGNSKKPDLKRRKTVAW